MKITVIKKSAGARIDSVCPWLVEIMEQNSAKVDSVCPWLVEIMDQKRS